jgi:HSP20 family protein
MSITRWQPQHDVSVRPRLAESIFDLPLLWPFDQAVRDLSFPQIDLREADDRYIVTASLPGFRKEDITVEAQGRQLTISAFTQEELERGGSEQRWWIRERRTGRVQRTITLPGEVDVDRATCTYRDGVLEIALPKGGVSGGHRIPILASGQARSSGGGWKSWFRRLAFWKRSRGK